MKLPLLDSSVFPTYKKGVEKYAPLSKFSLVVYYELTATSIDNSTLQKIDVWKHIAQQADRLLVPTKIDWINCAKAVRRLRHLRLIDKNLSATVLQNDALIARSAYLNDCFIVTENVRDFALLQKVMPKLEVIPAKEFFS